MHDPDDVDEAKRQHLYGDNNSVGVTAYQAQKCAAILEAYADGQTLYLDHINTVAQFLKTAALEAALGEGYSRPSAQFLWRRLEELSWPRHGGPQPQAD
jgi:hypothetical protein